MTQAPAWEFPSAKGRFSQQAIGGACCNDHVGSSVAASPTEGSAGEVFRAALRLGLTSFGGPVAHIGYFHDEYVTRRQWIGEQEFGELVALTNILPGPSSSQLGIAVGVHRAGKLGGLAAWLGFTLPSAVALTALALWARNVDLAGAGWVHGLELAAAAVVLTAVIAMARTLARGPVKAAIAIAATAVALLWPGTFGQLGTILVAGVVGGLLFRGRMPALPMTLAFPIGRRTDSRWINQPSMALSKNLFLPGHSVSAAIKPKICGFLGIIGGAISRHRGEVRKSTTG